MISRSFGQVGTLMYLSQDRWDVQFATKCLAAFMKTPTVQAMTCLKHLILYLKGTGELGFLLRYSQQGARMIEFLNTGLAGDVVDHSTHVLECFL